MRALDLDRAAFRELPVQENSLAARPSWVVAHDQSDTCASELAATSSNSLQRLGTEWRLSVRRLASSMMRQSKLPRRIS